MWVFETISEAIRDINMDGYIPILANLEQYQCLEEDEDKVARSSFSLVHM